MKRKREKEQTTKKKEGTDVQIIILTRANQDKSDIKQRRKKLSMRKSSKVDEGGQRERDQSPWEERALALTCMLV